MVVRSDTLLLPMTLDSVVPGATPVFTKDKVRYLLHHPTWAFIPKVTPPSCESRLCTSESYLIQEG